MKLKSNRDKSDADKFLEKFGKRNLKFRMLSTPLGDIISVDTDDKKIIEYLKKLGLN